MYLVRPRTLRIGVNTAGIEHTPPQLFYTPTVSPRRDYIFSVPDTGAAPPDILLDGTASLVLETAGALQTDIQMAGTSALVLTTGAPSVVTAIQMTGSATLALSTAADLGAAGGALLTAAATLALTTAGDLSLPLELVGSAVLVLQTAADLVASITMNGAGELVLTTAGDLTGGMAVVSEGGNQMMHHYFHAHAHP